MWRKRNDSVSSKPTLSQRVPASSQLHAFLALTTRRPRSASGTHLLHFWKALTQLSKSAPQTCPQRDQRLCAFHAHRKFCSSDALRKVNRVGVSAHNPVVLRPAFPHTPFKMSFPWIWKASKPVSMKPRQTDAPQQIDPAIKEKVSQWSKVHRAFWNGTDQIVYERHKRVLNKIKDSVPSTLIRNSVDLKPSTKLAGWALHTLEHTTRLRDVSQMEQSAQSRPASAYVQPVGSGLLAFPLGADQIV